VDKTINWLQADTMLPIGLLADGLRESNDGPWANPLCAWPAKLLQGTSHSIRFQAPAPFQLAPCNAAQEEARAGQFLLISSQLSFRFRFDRTDGESREYKILMLLHLEGISCSRLDYIYAFL